MLVASSHLAAFQSTELDPIDIHIAETVACDSRSPKVIVFINIHVEHRVKINKVLIQHWLQCFKNGRGTQPLLQAWRTYSIKYYAL
jgi:ribosomal protein L31E